jgi:flagellar hook-length control protein FliK
VPPETTGSQEGIPGTSAGRAAQVEPPAQPAPVNHSVPPATTDALTTTDGASPARSRADEARVRRDVRLTELAEQADAVIRLAVRNGLGSARITLSPQELGQVEIHLRYRSAGVIAELTAESAAAFQSLNQAGAELRRSLEAQGIIVLGLDIRHAGPDGNGDAGQGRSGERGSGEPAPDASEPDQEPSAASAPAVARVLTDTTVDILA